MKTNKYYTPDISEFYVGFEYEVEDLGDDGRTRVWRPQIFEGEETRTYFIEELQNNEMRVKYLDSDDIEECGFEELSEEDKEEMRHPILSSGKVFRGVSKYGTMNNQFYISPYHIAGKIDRMYIYMAHLGNGYHIKFEGTIKNKSELKRTLKQIGYEGK